MNSEIDATSAATPNASIQNAGSGETPQPGASVAPGAKQPLEFRATGGELFGFWLLTLLLTICTLGIYGFWRATAMRKWIAEHTYVHGQPMRYDSRLGEFILFTLVRVGLMMVTFLFYLPWGKCKAKRFQWRMTRVADGRSCAFDGAGSDFALRFVLNKLLIICTLGIARPWVLIRRYRWDQEHLLIGGERVQFVGRAGSLFWLQVTNTLLTLFTLGMYRPWARVRVQNWICQNSLVARGTVTEPTPPDAMDAWIAARATDRKTWIAVVGLIAGLFALVLLVGVGGKVVSWVSSLGSAEEAPFYTGVGEADAPASTLAVETFDDVQLEASSVYPATRTNNYDPERAIDGDTETWWGEGADGDGLGEYLHVSWDDVRLVREVSLVPGYWKYRDDRYGDRWVMNNRLERVLITFSSGHAIDHHFEDEKGWHTIPIEPAEPAQWVRITITDVYPGYSPKGKRIEDSGIAEITVRGTELIVEPAAAATGQEAKKSSNPFKFLSARKYKERRAEAQKWLDSVRTAEKAYEAAFDKYHSCPLTPSTVPGSEGAAWAGGGETDFNEIGWSPDAALVYCSFEVQATKNSFVATARCDIDGDGEFAIIEATESQAPSVKTAEDVY
jgi:hypothetical protein